MNTFLLSIRDFFKRVGHFIKNVFKLFKIAFSDKLKYKVVDEAMNGYWFDYGYLYNIEYAKLAEMKSKFEKYGMSTDNYNIIRQIDLAMKLLKIISDETDLFDFVDNEQSKYSSIGSKEWLGNKKYVCKVNVNLKNAKRFATNGEYIGWFNKWPHELYEAKARYLYHKLRYNFEQRWWD